MFCAYWTENGDQFTFCSYEGFIWSNKTLTRFVLTVTHGVINSHPTSSFLNQSEIWWDRRIHVASLYWKLGAQFLARSKSESYLLLKWKMWFLPVKNIIINKNSALGLRYNFHFSTISLSIRPFKAKMSSYKAFSSSNQKVAQIVWPWKNNKITIFDHR